MYAIVDIETTGSPANKNGITEIAIVLYNGKEIEGKYETLINPNMAIPPYVAKLTGISDQMVAHAPIFKEVAKDIHHHLKDRVFVAHNVGFDYPYVKYFLNKCGLNYTAKRLCTIKLSRKAFPRMERYGLDYLCQELDIRIDNHHRAAADAFATTVLFDKIIKAGGEKLVKSLIAEESLSNIPTV